MIGHLVSGEANWVTYPLAARPLPTAADFEHVLRCQLVQMFVVGRSGSGLVHAFLDGHPEVLHVPHTFKFYDFVASHPNLLHAGAATVIETFCESPLTAFLFDSSRSVIIGGRLGPGMKTLVRIDLAAFRAAFIAMVGDRELSWRVVFLGIVAAYGWTIGQDPAGARVVFHHVHHGDWLWPERLIDRSNYHLALPRPAAEILKADRFVVSLREPRDASLAYRRFIEGQRLPDPQRLDAHDQFARLLLQDWDRLSHALRAGLACHVVRIEDLRVKAAETMAACADWLGIDSREPSLTRLTYYGFEWFGDIYTQASSTVHAKPPLGDLSWQERWLCDVVLSAPGAAHGYPARRWTRAKARLLSAIALWPPALMSDSSIASRWQRWRAAGRRASARVAFAAMMRVRLGAW